MSSPAPTQTPSPTTGPTTAPSGGAIVVIGGGHAGAQACNALAAAGLGPRTHLVCAEPDLPYQRPPLSKAFLKSPDEAVQLHRAEAWFAEAGITVHRGDAAVAIDRTARSVTLASGRVLSYAASDGVDGWLVLATGAPPRTLAALQDGGRGLSNVLTLRSAADAQRLRTALAAAGQADTGRTLTVLGGGFIGLEVAATAQALGLRVQVLEMAPRLLGRSVSAELAEHVLAHHRAAGIDIRLGAKVDGYAVQDGRLASLSVDGVAQPVDLLLLAIGSVPDTTLAQAAGLDCQDGITVDAHQRSSDPHILAIGDCCRFPGHRLAAGDSWRLESVQNANDQAKTAVATILGQTAPYGALPWFWSEQGTLRLQMAGLMPPPDAPGVERHRRPGANPQSFSVMHWRDGQLVCVESVNAPMDHLMSRKILEAGKSPAPEVACDPGVALKTLA